MNRKKIALSLIVTFILTFFYFVYASDVVIDLDSNQSAIP